MKLAFVSYCGSPWGGCEVLWVATAKLALQNGHQVLVSVYDFGIDTHPKVKELELLGATMVYRKKFYPSFKDRLKKRLLHQLNINKKYTYLDFLNKYKPNHILFSLSGGTEVINNQDACLFLKNTHFKYSFFYHSIFVSSNYLIKSSIIFKELSNKACYNFFTSNFQIHNFNSSLGLSISNTKVVNHPIKVSNKSNLIFSANNIPTFATIGSLICRWKGQDLLLNIFSNKTWINRNFVLNIYGEGENKNYLDFLVKEYNLTNKVVFCGYETNINEIWSKNQLLLMPSKQDSGPIVCFEAMAASRAVVGSYMGAMPEYVATDYNGVLANGIMEHNFEEALEFAWQHQDKWEEWGKNAYKTMQEKYDFNPEKTLLNLLVNQ